ncbi:MAG TPA: transposase [Vicinamibacterales bacterium]|nr:transposase [Vicinamibacterales bacterium]
MPRRGLHFTGGLILHVLNRGVRRMQLFATDADYRAFLAAMAEGQAREGLSLLAYCVMPNHFHLVVWPKEHGQLVRFMWWFQATHSKRWHQFRGSHGTGPVYQGRYKAIPVQDDHHFLTVCRYVERNPVRANLVRLADRWSWSSLSQRGGNCNVPHLDPWPVLQPDNWSELVNRPEGPDEIDRIRRCIKRSLPVGSDPWARTKDPRRLFE